MFKLMSKGNGVDIKKMPQRCSLYLELDNLKKKIQKSKGTDSELSEGIGCLMDEINLGGDKDIINGTRDLLNKLKKFEIFSKNIEKIKSALEKIQTIQ